MTRSTRAGNVPWLRPLAVSALVLSAGPGTAGAQEKAATSPGAPPVASQAGHANALVPAGRQTEVLPQPAATPPAAPGSPPIGPVPPGYPPAACGPVPAAGSAPMHGGDAEPYRPFPATWQHTIDALVADGSIPGAVVIVKSPDWGVRVGVAGEANLVTHQKMAPDLQFRVGSVSKAFLAQAILRLEQQGRIRLSDHVLDYLGQDAIVAGIPDIGQVTIANLLQMTSGINNYLESHTVGFSPQVTPQKHFAPDALMGVLSAADPSRHGVSNGPEIAPLFAPGQTYPNPYWVSLFGSQPPAPAPYPSWYYSNSNYILLGMIAEKVTGLQAEEVLQRLVFDVAGLNDTYFATDGKRLPDMHGYTKYGSIPYPNPVFATWCDVTAIDPSYAWTAGAIVSTPWDLLKFEDAMFTSDTLLNQGTKNKWFTFVSADIHFGWEEMQYGVGGLMQPERAYGTARGHGGAFPGYKTLLYYFYDQKTSFVLSSNTWDNEWEVVMLDQIMPQVSSAVTTPRPENRGAAGEAAGDRLHLGWQAGRVYGSSYDVYLGTSAAAVDGASASSHDGARRQTVTTLDATVEVEPGTTYYWRVDTVAPGQALPLVIGPTWSFHTR